MENNRSGLEKNMSEIKTADEEEFCFCYYCGKRTNIASDIGGVAESSENSIEFYLCQQCSFELTMDWFEQCPKCFKNTFGECSCFCLSCKSSLDSCCCKSFGKFRIDRESDLP